MDGWDDDDIRDIRETHAGTSVSGTPQWTRSGNQRRVIVREDVGSPSRRGHRIGGTSSVGDKSTGPVKGDKSTSSLM